MKNVFANDSHNITPSILLANAPTYNILRLCAITALNEKPKKINTAEDNAIKIKFPDGSKFKKKDRNAERAIPLEIE